MQTIKAVARFLVELGIRPPTVSPAPGCAATGSPFGKASGFEREVQVDDSFSSVKAYAAFMLL